MELSEFRLVERAKRGDRDAFWQLAQAHAAHLFRVACALTGRAGDAEDIVQESLVAALEGIGRFQGRASLRTWLVSIVARQAALWHRRRGARHTVGMDDAALAGRDGPPTDVRLDVLQVLERLPEERRTVLVLREFEGMSYDEIALALHLPRGTVESRLHRARQDVRALLESYERA